MVEGNSFAGRDFRLDFRLENEDDEETAWANSRFATAEGVLWIRRAMDSAELWNELEEEGDGEENEECWEFLRRPMGRLRRPGCAAPRRLGLFGKAGVWAV